MRKWLHILLITPLVLTVAISCGTTEATQPAPYQRQDLPAVGQGASIYQEGHSTAPELFAQAQQFLSQGDVAHAEEIYHKIVDLEPNNPLGYIGIGSCRLHVKDLSAAKQNYQKALELDPKSTMALMGMGSIAYGRQQYADTIEWYQKALAIKPDLADAHYGVAIGYDASGQTEQARQHFEEFLQLAPSSNLATYVRQRLAELQVQPH